jgi:hypothetical protein
MQATGTTSLAASTLLAGQTFQLKRKASWDSMASKFIQWAVDVAAARV